MIYRGFKIERVSFYGNADPMSEGEQSDPPRQRAEFVVSETVGGYHWQEMGSTNSQSMAEEMIDRVVTVREALARVTGVRFDQPQDLLAC